MEWYYARGNDRVGPISEDEFQSLTATGAIDAATLVWHAGMTSWTAYGVLAPDQTPVPGIVEPLLDGGAGRLQRCIECGDAFPQDELIHYSGAWVCGGCKPVFFQRVREGAPVTGTFRYGGFWIRFVAKMVDGIIGGVLVNLPIAAWGFGRMFNPEAPFVFGEFLFNSLILVIFDLTYATFFIGRFGATPGKMICRLKVIRPDGEPVTYLRAFFRDTAEMLSYYLLLIGYLMAAFDSEKRSLHDRICDTRVVYKS